MAKPVQTRASVSIGSSLSEGRMLELAEKSSSAVDDNVGRIRLESRAAHSEIFSLRDHFEGHELMRFEVTTTRSVGRTTARTAITSFTVKEGGIASLVPMAKRKLAGFSAYEAFMDQYVSAVVAEDREAIVTLVDGKD
ncbi:hypothetical protein [Cellulomonas gilvus]|uniref:Uncharacterized protein n=1 Tax=Cellulomonas gilvus (strain ATCC 13127 / NRRL B-14078) TaxID=593907 RepID=F8A5I2_CELGA|nr:hypothetical protein [Cellulomonas gilvus]AEI12137.1 hypothetical protein Celgi_1626 [Cellulomonas gilvus ATCC 13127]